MFSLSVKEVTELAGQLKEGDLKAFSALYKATVDPQYFTALSILKDPYLAEDAIQVTYLKVYQNINRLSSPDLFLPWLSRINYNTCLNLLRYGKKVDTGLDLRLLDAKLEPQKDNSPLPLAIHRESQRSMLAFLNKLSLDHRTILILYYYQDLKIREIADILEISMGTAKSRIHYGLKRLKEILKENGYHSPESFLSAGLFLRHTFRPVKLQSVTNVLGSRKSVLDCLKITIASTLICLLLTGAARFLPVENITSVRIQAPEEYTNTFASIKITATPRSISHLEAEYENGRNLKVEHIGKNQFLLKAKHNGVIRIILNKDEGSRIVRKIEVTQIDKTPPTVNRYTRNNHKIKVFLEDDLSGVDYKQIVVMNGGQSISLQKTDPVHSYVEFTCKNSGQVSLKLKDMVGNSETIWLKTVSRYS